MVSMITKEQVLSGSARIREWLTQQKYAESKKALFVPGASLNAACTAGMLAALETANALDRFDLIVGTSAGSFSAAYFVGYGSVQGATGYWTVMPDFVGERRFFHFKRFLGGRPILDVAAVIQEVFTERAPLPWARVVDSQMNKEGKFCIQALDANTGQIVLLRRFQTVRALKAGVSGSCWLPLLAGTEPYHFEPKVLEELEVTDKKFNPLHIRQLSVFDGSVGDYYMFGVRRAAKPALSIYLEPFTPEVAYRRLFMERRCIRRCITRSLLSKYPAALDTYDTHVLHNSRAAQLRYLLKEAAKSDATIAIVCPAEAVEIGNAEGRPHIFKSAVLNGWTAAARALELPVHQVPAAWVGEAAFDQ
jgi:hypothetical protein